MPAEEVLQAMLTLDKAKLQVRKSFWLDACVTHKSIYEFAHH